MTQEKQLLLLKDLCGRLPYGVKVQFKTPNYKTNEFDTEVGEAVSIDIEKRLVDLNCKGIGYNVNISSVKPYLRSLSNMTDEEKSYLNRKYNWNFEGDSVWIKYHSEGYWDDDTECSTDEYLKLFDWFNEHHLDYRGLIPMGLALEAPEDMYKNKLD